MGITSSSSSSSDFIKTIESYSFISALLELEFSSSCSFHSSLLSSYSPSSSSDSYHSSSSFSFFLLASLPNFCGLLFYRVSSNDIRLNLCFVNFGRESEFKLAYLYKITSASLGSSVTSYPRILALTKEIKGKRKRFTFL